MRNGFSARGFGALASAIVLLAACAHSGTSELVPAAGPNRALTIISSGPGNAVTVTGAITSLTSSGFVFNAGFNENAMNVDDTGASITGASPFVGENVQVRGTGDTASVSAANVDEIIGTPKGVSYFSGTLSNASATSFVIHTASGYLPGTYNAQTTIIGGPLAVGKYAQAAGTGGSRSFVATYLSLWPGGTTPGTVAVGGIVSQITPWGFQLNVGTRSVPVVLYSSTKFTGPALVTGGTASINGIGSSDQSVVATSISVPTPQPASTPPPIVLTSGGVVGLDNQFVPTDSDTKSGGQGQTVDGIPCATTMSENAYHVHAWIGLLVDGRQIAIPDAIGMYGLGPEINGYSNYASCFYYLHTHDATGMIHIESPSTAPLSSTIYTLGNLFDVWGMTISSTQVGPFTGTVRAFVANAPGATYAYNYIEYAGDARNINLYSHEAVWLEVGPTFVVPPSIRPIRFYTQY